MESPYPEIHLVGDAARCRRVRARIQGGGATEVDSDTTAWLIENKYFYCHASIRVLPITEGWRTCHGGAGPEAVVLVCDGLSRQGSSARGALADHPS